MKAKSFLLTALLLSACALPNSSRYLYSGKLPAPSPSLADDLPADTLFYVDIAALQKMRADMANSDLGKTFYDQEMQDFIGGGLELLANGWEDIRSMMSEQGLPGELLAWDTLHSFSAGLALRARPGLDSPFDEEPELYFLAELGLGEGRGEQVFQLITDMATEEGLQLEEGELKMPLSEIADLRLWRQGDRIRCEAVMGAKGEGILSEDQEFRRSRLQVQADGAAIFGYMDFEKLFATLSEGLNGELPQFSHLFGKLYGDLLAPMHGIAFASGWSDRGTYTIAKVDLADDSQEADSLFHVLPYDPALLEMIPAEAASFSIASSDHDAGTKLMLDLMDEIAATELQPGMTVGQMLQGSSAEAYAWLFGEHRAEMEAAAYAFGDRSFSYTTSNGLQSETLGFMEVRDPEALNGVLEQMMPRLKEVVDEVGQGYVTMKMKRVMRTVDGEKVPGPAYYYLDLDLSSILPPQLAGLIQLQPTIGVSEDGWMVFSMARNPVRNVLMNGVPVPEENILGNEDVQAFLAKAPQDAFSIAWGDPRPTIDALAGMALGFAPMVMGPLEQEMDLPFTLDDLPSAALFTRYLRPSESFAYETHGDLITKSYGSIGLADMFTFVGSAISVAGPIGVMVSSETMEAMPIEDSSEF